jgi:hypothetical protein
MRASLARYARLSDKTIREQWETRSQSQRRWRTTQHRQPLAGRDDALRSANHWIARVDQDHRLGEHRPQPRLELGRQPGGFGRNGQRTADAVEPFPAPVTKPAAVSSRRASSIPRWEYVSTTTLMLECPNNRCTTSGDIPRRSNAVAWLSRNMYTKNEIPVRSRSQRTSRSTLA